MKIVCEKCKDTIDFVHEKELLIYYVNKNKQYFCSFHCVLAFYEIEIIEKEYGGIENNELSG